VAQTHLKTAQKDAPGSQSAFSAFISVPTIPRVLTSASSAFISVPTIPRVLTSASSAFISVPTIPRVLISASSAFISVPLFFLEVKRKAFDNVRKGAMQWLKPI